LNLGLNRSLLESFIRNLSYAITNETYGLVPNRTKLHITVTSLDTHCKRTKRTGIKIKRDFTSHFHLTFDPNVSRIEYRHFYPRQNWPKVPSKSVVDTQGRGHIVM
jgi:hypothetical protein